MAAFWFLADFYTDESKSGDQFWNANPVGTFGCQPNQGLDLGLSLGIIG